MSIFDDGSDCHPPGFIAKAGDKLHVFDAHNGWITVSHDSSERSYNTFLVKSGEVELYWEQPDLFPEELSLSLVPDWLARAEWVDAHLGIDGLPCPGH